jgi:hypothetical protein
VLSGGTSPVSNLHHRSGTNPADPTPAPGASARMGRRGFLMSGGGALAWVAISGLPFPRATTRPGIESARLRLIDPVAGYSAGGAAPTVGAGWSTTARLPIPGQMVSLRWTGSTTARLALRSHRPAQGWSDWSTVHVHAGEGPDHDSPEAGAAPSAGPIWVGDGTDQVELRVDSGSLTGLELDTLRSTEGRTSPFSLTTAAASTAFPGIHPRSAWGAGPWMAGHGECRPEPIKAGRLRMAIVHHTVSTNTYSQAQARDLIRGIYHHHVNLNGWCDIAYNFFIDRFGTVYEGRTDSLHHPVVGGHAAGFNTGSVGIALLGQYHPGASPAAVSVSSAQRAALRRLCAWLFAEYGVDAGARIWFSSFGNARFPEGTPVLLPTITTHRDVGTTSCPGNNTIPILAGVRTEVQRDVAFSAPTKSRWSPQDTGPSMVVLDAFGGVHPAGITPAITNRGTYWPNWKIARGVVLHDRHSGHVLDAYGGLHPFGGAPRVQSSAYRANQDAMRGITAGPVPGSGYVLERTGDLHPFGGAPAVGVSGRWPAGWNTAIAAASNPAGTGGYVLDAFGALHSWGDAPRATGITGYWHGWRIARDVALRPDGTSGWVLDAYGGLHPFGGAPRVPSPWYTAGQDRFRTIIADSSGTGGWVLDRDGAIHAFGGAAQVAHHTTFTGLGIATVLAASPIDRGAVA